MKSGIKIFFKLSSLLALSLVVSFLNIFSKGENASLSKVEKAHADIPAYDTEGNPIVGSSGGDDGDCDSGGPDGPDGPC